MRYIIMAGGNYTRFETPKQLTEIDGEPLVARTIRLLREAGVEDIAISSNDARFEAFGAPVLHHDNDWTVRGDKDNSGWWVDCFYPTDEPVCYIFGDVYFSPEAIRTIVETETFSIMLFGSKKPFAPDSKTLPRAVRLQGGRPGTVPGGDQTDEEVAHSRTVLKASDRLGIVEGHLRNSAPEEAQRLYGDKRLHLRHRHAGRHEEVRG